MNRFIMLVGIPGAGKSTIAREYEHRLTADNVNCRIFSSDDIREELYGDASIQGDPAEVFGLLENRLFDYLSTGNEVAAIYDATNLSSKGRRAFLKRAKSRLSYCFFECVFVACRISECKRRQFGRDHKVPEEVIERMARSFQAPFYNEGWDHIRLVAGGPLYDMTQEHMAAWSMEHDNPHHTLSIGKHMATARDHISTSDNRISLAAYHHDIGKPHTKSFVNSKGETSPDAHYYSHESVGSYMWLSSHDALGIYPEDAIRVGAFIQYHMMPYFVMPIPGETVRDAMERWGSTRGFSKEFINQLWQIHLADEEAH